MKKILLGAIALFGALEVYAAIDPATYTPISNTTLTSVWSQSRQVGSLPTYITDPAGANGTGDLSRGMTYANGKLYVPFRLANGSVIAIYVYSATDGSFIKRVDLDPNLFSGVGYPLNCIRTDAAGHLVISNMTLDLGTGRLLVYRMDNEDATPVKVLDFTINTPETGLDGGRIDYLSVYGDLATNGYIIAAVSGPPAAGTSERIWRWDIVNGVAPAGPLLPDGSDFDPNFHIYTVSGYDPSTSVDFGTAPFILPIDNQFFYVDGASTYPTLYKVGSDGMSVSLYDGFDPAGVSDLRPAASNPNGCAEFTVGGRNFFIFSTTDAVAYSPIQMSSFVLNEFGPATAEYPKGFAGMSHLYTFPTAGMGSTNTNSRVVLPLVHVNGNVAEIYVFSNNNGFARYDLTVTTTGIQQQQVSGVSASYQSGNIILSETVASVAVYSITGQQMLSASHVNMLPAALANGVYIVKTVSDAGVSATQKIVVR